MNRTVPDQHPTPGRNRLCFGWQRPLESKAAIALLCSMFLIFGGCTTTQTVDPRSPAETQVDLKPGETVVVYLSDGRDLELSVVEWTNEHLVGRDRADMTHTVVRRDIARLEVSRFSPGKTASLVVAAIAVVALAHAVVEASVGSWLVPPLSTY